MCIYKPDTQKVIDTENSIVITREKRGWRIVKGTGGREYGDRRRFDFG